MKPFRIRSREKKQKAGFGLAEVSFSLGVVSFGFLCLAPLLTLGVMDSRQARNERTSAQIGETLAEQARQGTLVPGTQYLDDQGAVLNSAQAAAYTATSSETGSGALTQWTVRVTPAGAPASARVYAVVVPAPAAN